MIDCIYYIDTLFRKNQKVERFHSIRIDTTCFRIKLASVVENDLFFKIDKNKKIKIKKNVESSLTRLR